MESSTWFIIFMLMFQRIHYTECMGLTYEVRSLADSLGSTIHRIFEDTTRSDELSREYSFYVQKGYMKIKRVVGTEIFKDLSLSLGSLLGQKINAMKRAVEFAENEASDHKWKPELNMDTVRYVNAKEFESAEHRLAYEPLFLQSVVRNESSVHIPTEIFKGDIEVLNGITWSQSLDHIWADNWKKDPNLLWQYFASQRGFFRMFPGMKWRKKGVDMYDCRRRPWYVQGSSSAKDVMVLIDTSGSMHGKSLQLTKLAVKHTIDTLGENDYVAVMQFPGAHAKKLKPGVKRDKSPHILKDDDGSMCFRTFVQATKRNKYRIFKQVDSLRAHGIADMTAALELAFKTFLEFSSRENPYNRGADCNRIIIILSDDAATYPKERIEELRKHNPILQRIRIFTYAVGSDVHTTKALQQMACDFKGTYNRIPAYGAVTHIIHDVSTVLSRPMYLAEGKFFVWHNIYLDSLGLGLMTSLTMPLYNRSANYSLLGLMGTDVTVADMQELLPLEKLGVNGYAFAINLNGYIVFHPGLKSQRGWMRDPPNVDLLEVEFDSAAKREVRRKIIDSGADGVATPNGMDISGFIKVVDEIHVYNKTRRYIYGALPYSKFGMTVVLPVEAQFYPSFSGLPEHDLKINADGSFAVYDKVLGQRVLLDLSADYGVALTSDIDYCERYLRPPEPTPTPAANVSAPGPADNGSLLFRPEEGAPGEEEEIRQPRRQPEVGVTDFLRTLVFNQSHCRRGPSYRFHFMKHLLLDLVATQRHMDWLRRRPQFLRHNASVLSVFVTTNGGVTRVFPESESRRYHSFRNTRKSSEYTRAFDMDRLLLWTPLSLGKPAVSSFAFNRSTPPVTIFKSFSIIQPSLTSVEEYKLGVMGISIHQEVLSRVLSESPACDEHNSDFVCYLVEDAAYVVAVNKPELHHGIGFFLGYVDPVLMNHLLNTSVFGRVKEFDYQASCPKETIFTSSASSPPESTLHRVVYSLLSSLEQLMNAGAELSLALFNLLIPILSVQAQEATATTSNENESCIKLGYRYYMTGKSLSNEIQCSRCIRRVVATPIEGTNSILIVASPPCQGCPDSHYPLRDPVKDPGPDLCEESEQPRYRRRRRQCYDLDPNEDKEGQCSGATALTSSRTFLFLLFLQSLLCGV